MRNPFGSARMLVPVFGLSFPRFEASEALLCDATLGSVVEADAAVLTAGCRSEDP